MVILYSRLELMLVEAAEEVHIIGVSQDCRGHSVMDASGSGKAVSRCLQKSLEDLLRLNTNFHCTRGGPSQPASVNRAKKLVGTTIIREQGFDTLEALIFPAQGPNKHLIKIIFRIG